METRSGKKQAREIKDLFARVAQHYDKANRWMTWGQDHKWRGEVIDRANLPRGGALLDIGTGTGDLALQALRRDPTLCVVAADFTPEMMQVGRKRPSAGQVGWMNADALELPYLSESFDAVVSAYLLRNVIDVQAALLEQYRVLKPGGRVVCLDATQPPGDLWHLPVRLYLWYIIPIIGGWASGDVRTYRYLPESTAYFLSPVELAGCMRKAGFQQVSFRSFMGGCMAIHWGTK